MEATRPWNRATKKHVDNRSGVRNVTAGFQYSWSKMETELDEENWVDACVPLRVTRHTSSQVKRYNKLCCVLYLSSVQRSAVSLVQLSQSADTCTAFTVSSVPFNVLTLLVG